MSTRRSQAPRRAPSTRSSRSKAPEGRLGPFAVTGLVALGFLAALGLGIAAAARWSGPGTGKDLRFEVTANLETGALVEQLSERGLVRSPWLAQLYFSTLGADPLAVGPHLLRDSDSLRELQQRLTRGTGRRLARITLPEGWDHLRIAERLESEGICSAQDFVSAVRDPTLLRPLGIRGSSAEGYLFPATYPFRVDSSPSALVEQLVLETRRRLRKVADELGREPLARLAEERAWGEFELLTLASIVERESADPEERAQIASVFFNRLDSTEFRPRGALQSDPTAAYGCLLLGAQLTSCQGPPRKVTPSMLRDAANPYNTYTHAGLPPGPIANPGVESLRAVLAPAKTDYFYFVAIGQGKHRFSHTFDEHRRAIDQGSNSSPAASH